MSLNEQGDFASRLARRVEEVDRIVAAYLPSADGYQAALHEAMAYGMAAGGKRIRPILLRESYRLFTDEDTEVCHPLMAAVEMIHSYSLIHDDLPAIDDDEYRRGRKTVHVVYGEAMAILAGDGLLNLAFETALRVFDRCEAGRAIRACRVLAAKAGISGMIGGQVADVLAEGDQLAATPELLYFIHEHKTAALIEAAMMCGAILGGAGEAEAARVERAARDIGVAFQIQDDILDVSGSFADMGKLTGGDEERAKLTAVALLGQDEAQRRVADLSREAIAILDSLPRPNAFLTELVTHMAGRRR